MDIVKITVKDVTTGTVSNIDGLNLKFAIDKALAGTDSIILSFEGVNTLSSSFLNSSIGDIIENHSFDILKNRLRITNYTPVIANTIMKYINDLRLTDHA
jgi:hypothetical protein